MNRFARTALYTAMAGSFALASHTSVAGTQVDAQFNPTAQPKALQLAGKCNPCNPCAAKKGCNPCNPCAAKKACNPCNPCAAKKACNPCNPCAAKKKKY